jgi:chemotaxis protein MotB
MTDEVKVIIQDGVMMEVPADMAESSGDEGAPPRRYAKPALPEHRGDPAWMVTFTDTMGLLLTFFVMLFAMSSPKTSEGEKGEDTRNLSPLVEAHQFEGAAKYAGDEDAISVNKIDYNKALDLGYLKNVIESFQNKNEMFSRAHLIQDDANRRLIVSLPQDLLFSPGKSVLSEDGRKVVHELSGALSHLRNGIEVVGHADPRAQAKAGKTNWDLSLERAAVVALEMTEKGGLGRDPVVKAYSSGLYHMLPAAMPEDKKLALSRRVDVIINDHDGSLQQRFGIAKDSPLR